MVKTRIAFSDGGLIMKIRASLWYVYEDLEKTCTAMGIYIYFLVLAGITLEWFFFQL
jgi:hypothetical protein